MTMLLLGLLKILSLGIKGLILAALSAAIVSSLASMLNSTSTIFTMDIYKSLINKKADDKSMVKVGRLSVLLSLNNRYAYCPSVRQSWSGISVYSGIYWSCKPWYIAVFLMGLFYKKATNNAAIWGVISSIPIAMFFKVAPNEWSSLPNIY